MDCFGYILERGQVPDCVSPVYLIVYEFSPCFTWTLMIGLLMVLLTFFHIMSLFLLKGSWCYSREWLWNLSTKLLYFFRDVKCKQGFTTGIWYHVYVLGSTIWSAYQWLMDSKSEIRCSSPGSFPMRGGYEFAIQLFWGF